MRKMERFVSTTLVASILLASAVGALASGGGGGSSSRKASTPSSTAPSAPAAPSGAITGGGSAEKMISAKGGRVPSVLKEGGRLRMLGTVREANGRYLLVSRETGKSYKLLENSALEKMTSKAHSKKVLTVTARATEFKGESYLFVTEFSAP